MTTMAFGLGKPSPGQKQMKAEISKKILLEYATTKDDNTSQSRVFFLGDVAIQV